MPCRGGRVVCGEARDPEIPSRRILTRVAVVVILCSRSLNGYLQEKRKPLKTGRDFVSKNGPRPHRRQRWLQQPHVHQQPRATPRAAQRFARGQAERAAGLLGGSHTLVLPPTTTAARTHLWVAPAHLARTIALEAAHTAVGLLRARARASRRRRPACCPPGPPPSTPPQPSSPPLLPPPPPPPPCLPPPPPPPRCPRGPRQMGWPGHMGTDEARATWALPIGCNSHGPRATVSLIRQSDLLLLLCGLLAPLALSPSRAHLPLPTKFLISSVPQRAGLRAVVGPCRPRSWDPCMPEARDPR